MVMAAGSGAQEEVVKNFRATLPLCRSWRLSSHQGLQGKQGARHDNEMELLGDGDCSEDCVVELRNSGSFECRIA